MVLYGVNYDESVPCSIEKVTDAISSAWSSDGRSCSKSFGFVDVRPIRDYNGFIYVAKYISKKNAVPKGKNPNFVLQSRKPGLGANLLSKDLLKHYTSYPDKPYYIFNKFSGKVEEFILTRYYLRKVLPSFSDFFSKKVRKLIDAARYTIERLRTIYHFPDVVGIAKSYATFSNYIPFSFPVLKVPNPPYYYTKGFPCKEEVDNLRTWYFEIANFVDNSGKNLFCFIDILRCRNKLLDKYALMDCADTIVRSTSARKHLALLESKIKI